MAVYKRYDGKKVKRGDKSYDKATWYMRFRVRGRSIHQSIPEAQTLKEAKLAEQSVKSAIFSRKYDVRRSERLDQFVKRVYIPYVEEKNKATVTDRKLHLKNTILPKLGNFLIEEITPNKCRELRKAYKNQPTKFGERANSTVNRTMATLSKILSLAVQENLIDRNPVHSLRPLTESLPRNRILTNDEKLRFWNVISDDVILFRLTTIAIHTGLRRGQILAINADDIDLKNYLIYASASKGRNRRPIPLNQTMISLFSEILRETPTGEIFPFTSFRTRWDNALRKAKIENFRFHDLKHAFATALFNAGVPRDRIEFLFAHSSPAITNRYINPDMRAAFDAVNRLDDNVEVVEKLQ